MTFSRSTILLSVAMCWATAIGAVMIRAQKPTDFGHPPLCQVDTEVEISGTCRSVFYYGPPNYGENPETDEHFHYLEFSIDNPPDILDEDGLAHYLGWTQLVVFPETGIYWNVLLRGRHILRGHFEERDSPHHRLPYIFIVTSCSS